MDDKQRRGTGETRGAWLRARARARFVGVLVPVVDGSAKQEP